MAPPRIAQIVGALLAGLLTVSACSETDRDTSSEAASTELCVEFEADFEEIENFAANPILDNAETIVAMRESMQAFVDSDPPAAARVGARDVLDALEVLLDGAESGAESGSTFELRAAESKLQAGILFLYGVCDG